MHLEPICSLSSLINREGYYGRVSDQSNLTMYSRCSDSFNLDLGLSKYRLRFEVRLNPEYDGQSEYFDWREIGGVAYIRSFIVTIYSTAQDSLSKEEAIDAMSQLKGGITLPELWKVHTNMYAQHLEIKESAEVLKKQQELELDTKFIEACKRLL